MSLLYANSWQSIRMTDRTDDFRLIAAALPPPGGVSPAEAKVRLVGI